MSREQQRTISQHWHRGYACACAVCSAYRVEALRQSVTDEDRAAVATYLASTDPEATLLVLERAEHGQLETLRHLFR